MVRSGFKLPPIEVSETSFSLLDQLIYADWDHHNRVFMPPKRFSLLNPMEEKFKRKCCMPLVEAAISLVKKM